MFCTGGIRCEKSTSLLLQEGFKEVYHLKGGILKYLEETPAEESLWEGECFVFDGRTAVTHGVEEGQNTKCHACGWPLTPEEQRCQVMNTAYLVCTASIKLPRNKKKVSVCVNRKFWLQNVNVSNSSFVTKISKPLRRAFCL